MDPKYLEELKKLKEQKDTDLSKIQDLADLSIPDFEEDTAEGPVPEEQEEATGETIKFEPITQPEAEEIHTETPSGGRRGRKPNSEELAQKEKKAKTKKIILISAASTLAVIAILLAVFFGVRHANRSKFTYQYWGMGIAIENGVYKYSFFGNLKNITLYDEIGQVEALAEFEKGNCIKETVYTPEGDVAYYYAHEYNDKDRTLSAYYEYGQLVQSVKYTRIDDTRIRAEKTHYLEENLTETSILTLQNGNLQIEEFYDGEILLHRNTYRGTLVTESGYYLPDGNISGKTVYEYNSDKQLITQTDYDAENNILTRMVNQYNEKGLLTKTLHYDSQGNTENYITYNYDLNNNPIKQVSYSGDGTMQEQILRTFNSKNRVTKETCLLSDGSIVYCNGYDYDEKGYVKKFIVYNVENSTFIDKYTLYQRSKEGSIEADTYNSSNILIEKSIYNAAGFITELYQFNEAGIMVLEEHLKYNENQWLIQKDTSNYSDNGDKSYYLSEQYNKSNLVTVRICEDFTAGSYDHYIFQYNKAGLKSQETLYDRNGKTVHDRLFNDKEEVVSESLYEKGKETFFNEYTYDNEGRVATMKSLDINLSKLVKTSYSYNEAGLLSSALESDASDKPISEKKYDAKGNVEIQTDYDYQGEIDTMSRYQYDKENRIISKEVFDKDGNMTSKTIYYYRTDGTFNYTEYDGEGNIIDDSRGPEYIPGYKEDEDTNSGISTDDSDSSTSSKKPSGTTSDNTSEKTDSQNS